MSRTIKNGKIASPGIKIGKAFVLKGTDIVTARYKVLDDQVEFEIERFKLAIEKTQKDIIEIQKQTAKSLSKDLANIFTSHLMVLEDPLIIDKTIETIQKDKKNVEWVLDDITQDLITNLSSIEDNYIRERIIDITDIHKKIISNLQNIKKQCLSNLTEEIIIFAPDITPSETATMNTKKALAFVTDHGNKTSHTAIMARALKIPAIVSTKNCTTLVMDDDIVIVDAIRGNIIINPSEEEIQQYKKYKQDYLQFENELAKVTDLPSLTLDSIEIFIYGNIEIPEEKKAIKEHGAQGIGLFRSEFLFIGNQLPSEQRQFQEYKKVAKHFEDMPVTIRTIDVGGDKVFINDKSYKESNPFLGSRAIRFSLKHLDIFKTQIRAILRASHFGNIKIMFPMITTVEEFIEAKSYVEKIKEELKSENISYDENIEIGLMIEVPSALIQADIIAKHADFFSVGTNDLVQYLLAVDRISDTVAHLYNPLNITVLRMLKQLVETSNKHSIPLSICGEMAGEPQYTMILLGLGFRNLSMGPTYMHQVKKIIRSVDLIECETLVEDLLLSETTNEIEEKTRQVFKKKFAELYY